MVAAGGRSSSRAADGVRGVTGRAPPPPLGTPPDGASGPVTYLFVAGLRGAGLPLVHEFYQFNIIRFQKYYSAGP